MTAKKLYHRLYARVVRARLRWSASPPVFFARKRYWLSTMVAVAVVIGAVASVFAWRSHVERANRELDAQALAGATSVVNAYCDAILKGNVDEAAAMDGLADSTDPNWMLSDAGEDFTVAAGTFVSLSVSEGEMSPDRLTATFDVTSTPRVGMAAREESMEMVARRDSVDAPWTIATSLAQTVTVELPGATTDVLFSGATIASFNPVAEWPVKGRALTLTLYPGKYEIGARSFSSEARLRSLPGKGMFLYRDDKHGAVQSQFTVLPSRAGAVTVTPFAFDATVLEKETEFELVELITECIDTQGSSSHLCPDATTNAPPRVKQADLRHELDYYGVRVTMDSPTTFTIESLRFPDPAPGTAESYTGSGTLSYDENGNEAITGITLAPSQT